VVDTSPVSGISPKAVTFDGFCPGAMLLPRFVQETTGRPLATNTTLTSCSPSPVIVPCVPSVGDEVVSPLVSIVDMAVKPPESVVVSVPRLKVTLDNLIEPANTVEVIKIAASNAVKTDVIFRFINILSFLLVLMDKVKERNYFSIYTDLLGRDERDRIQ
jgi:hypothetical protein